MTTNSHHARDPDFIDGQYFIHCELGSGGFGKVKLATHALTGEQVAIKIIDKKAVGEELFRVYNELEVLKKLVHQNICRMYQFYEDEFKCYFVMEYCNGGEMFDYIVKKERLKEPEARFFFRQLLQSMAYVHSNGVCHRDLKPENVMLTADLQLKLIDFGLAARPKHGLSTALTTCCGSPAYAAPEIVQNDKYYGHEADIWSMGVLLYVLLCGVLPFEDENLPQLYQKIKRGVYYEPDYLSPPCKEILRAMLQVNPRHRISMKDLREHRWVAKSYDTPLKWGTVYDKNIVDTEVAVELAFYHGIHTQRMINELKEWKFDYTTSTYLILLRRKEQGLNYAMPMYRRSKVQHVLHSPTIHKSLENDLDKVHGEGPTIGPDTISDTSTGAVACVSPVSKFIRSPYLAMNNQRHQDIIGTPILSARHKQRMNKERENKENKENQFASLRVKGPIRLDAAKQDSLYATPRRPGLPVMGSTGRTHKKRACSTERAKTNLGTPELSSPSMNDSTKSSTSRDGTSSTRRLKSSQIPRRVFTSLERGGAKLKNFLTPKKYNNNKDEPMRLNLADDSKLANLSMTSSDDCAKIREQLLKVLLDMDISVTANKWKISGKKSATMPGTQDTVVELEIVWVETLQLVGVLRRRLTGDAMTYKKICEQVLALAGL
ncbi:hypothetical protein FO519_005861 [Halicephalobus sp. NKZ332]|nr:hypothetical protein FO519_005861 [Halicephalobus sp. NKZ332]